MWMIPEKHEFHSDIVLCCYWLSALSYSFLIGWLEWAELCSRLSCVNFAVYRELLCLLLAVSCSVLLSDFVKLQTLCCYVAFKFLQMQFQGPVVIFKYEYLYKIHQFLKNQPPPNYVCSRNHHGSIFNDIRK